MGNEIATNPLNLNRASRIVGWMSNRELEWIGKNALECFEIVEVGCYKGRSTRAWCDNTKGVVYAVDTWSGTYYQNDGNPLLNITSETFREFLQNTEDCENL